MTTRERSGSKEFHVKGFTAFLHCRGKKEVVNDARAKELFVIRHSFPLHTETGT